jgi:hypothetical protein
MGRTGMASTGTTVSERAASTFRLELAAALIHCRTGDPTNPGGYADALATSLALHLQPDMVRREVIAWPPSVAGGPEQPAA